MRRYPSWIVVHDSLKNNMSAKFGRPPFTDTAANMVELQAEHAEIYAETEILDVHVHGHEHWLGLSTDQSGDNWGSDTLSPFVTTSGLNAYWENGKAKVLGVDDTPITVGGLYFDLHRILVTAVSLNTVYKVRFIWGTGTMVQAISDDQWTEVMVKFDALNPQQSAGIPFDISIPRLAVETKVWAQCKNLADLATIAFYIGIHEYIE